MEDLHDPNTWYYEETRRDRYPVLKGTVACYARRNRSENWRIFFFDSIAALTYFREVNPQEFNHFSRVFNFWCDKPMAEPKSWDKPDSSLSLIRKKTVVRYKHSRKIVFYG